jgi:4a-hydroxytetrahydrobiopterin dehydratase
MTLLSDQQINEKLQAFRGWELVDNKIQKTYRVSDFVKAVELVNKIAVVAEHMNHHPDVLIHNYNQLTISSNTHSEGGVTEKDINLAKEIEKLMALEI